MARYPVEFYPVQVRLWLTWVVPVGGITTIPAQALRGGVPLIMLTGSLLFALVLVGGASVVV
jgi:ABC-2 type transport system permease protein